MPPFGELILVNRELLLEVIEVLAEVLIRFLQVIDRTASVQNGCVVFSAAVQSDVCQRALGHLLREVHRNLSSLYDFTFPGLALE